MPKSRNEEKEIREKARRQKTGDRRRKTKYTIIETIFFAVSFN